MDHLPSSKLVIQTIVCWKSSISILRSLRRIEPTPHTQLAFCDRVDNLSLDIYWFQTYFQISEKGFHYCCSRWLLRLMIHLLSIYTQQIPKKLSSIHASAWLWANPTWMMTVGFQWHPDMQSHIPLSTSGIWLLLCYHPSKGRPDASVVGLLEVVPAGTIYITVETT